MADGFHTSYIESIVGFLRKENYNKENYKHKVEKISFMNIHI